MTQGEISVAVLDDEPNMRVALRRLLECHGFHVELCESYEYFLAAVECRRPDCLLLDLHMPGLSGLEILGLMASRQVAIPTVVITGRDEPGTEARVRGLGAVNYLLKPLDESTLVQSIRDACAVPAGGGLLRFIQRFAHDQP
jgi:FixJ family two-component response regulator